MPDPRIQTQSARTRRFAITIPASASTNGATIRALLVAAGYDQNAQGSLIGVKILGLKADGTDRSAFDVANTNTAASFTAVSQRVALAADYIEPAADDADSAVRAVANATIAAVAVAYLD